MAQLHEMLSEALQSEIDEAGGGLVTAVTTVAEVLLDDGQPHLVTLYDDDAPMWHISGMLTFALRNLENASTAEVLTERLEEGGP